MPQSVKTLLLGAIATAVAGVTGISRVYRNPTKQLEIETAVWDFAFIVDDAEINEDRNRTQRKTFPLVIEVWTKETEIPLEERMETYQAEVLDKLLNNDNVKLYSLNIVETGAEKFFMENNVGAIQLLYSVQYAHVWKNAYDPAR